MKEKIFISYSHKDSRWKDMLIAHLKATRSTHIEPWDDTRIELGSNWYEEIQGVIKNSSIAILLISADFLASDFIQTEEVPRLLLRHRSDGLRLLPIIIRPCSWKLIDWLSMLQAKPWEGKPLTSMSEHEVETCLSSIAEDVVKMTRNINIPYLLAPGSMLTPSIPYTPARLVGLKLNNNDPLRLTFIMALGDEPESETVVYSEAAQLVDYFLTCLAIPEKDLWVNLSPAEKDRIIPDTLGKTMMGKDLLAQDYLLKQFNASLMYPELPTGKLYWEVVYGMMEESYGSTEGTMNTFNKVWIVPEIAKISQFGGVALTTDEQLDVLMEQDYKALMGHIKVDP
uniref:TIR domain-containing protein n=1 Tax=Candidatus Kentrum sp. DK TaxID=2126562 RepID=A0A450TEM9_9GAMM|nr:MAG: TIR domain-containing protein [Candidatus Kentron sp. DK]